MKLDIRPLTKSRWKDLVELFNRPGGSIVRGCWCMAYRISGPRPFRSARLALKAIVDRGGIPGLIGYEAGRPVGWVSLGPREEYAKLRRSPVMKPVDEKPVWSIVCFFVDSKARGRGVSEALLKGAVEYARSKGATLLESYAVDKPGRLHPDTLWFGSKAMYERQGFNVVARRKKTRPVMRKGLRPRPV